MAALAEGGSEHPLAAAVLGACRGEGKPYNCNYVFARTESVGSLSLSPGRAERASDRDDRGDREEKKKSSSTNVTGSLNPNPNPHSNSPNPNPNPNSRQGSLSLKGGDNNNNNNNNNILAEHPELLHTVVRPDASAYVLTCL